MLEKMTKDIDLLGAASTPREDERISSIHIIHTKFFPSQSGYLIHTLAWKNKKKKKVNLGQLNERLIW